MPHSHIRHEANRPSASLCCAGKCLATSPGTHGARAPHASRRCSAPHPSFAPRRRRRYARPLLANALKTRSAPVRSMRTARLETSLEGLADGFCHLQVHRRIPDNLAFAAGGLDQRRGDALGRGGAARTLTRGQPSPPAAAAPPSRTARRVSLILGITPSSQFQPPARLTD